jgi:hypothetical protein
MSLLFANLELVQPRAIIWPAIVSAGIAVVSWLVLVSLVSNHRAAALAVTTLMLSTFNHAGIAHLAGSSPIVIPLIYAGVVGFAVVLLRAGERAKALTTHATQILTLALIALIVAIGAAEWARPTLTVESEGVVATSDASDRPDVYVLILDGYGRADILRDQYSFDNTLVPALRSRGFFVADESASNYPQTTHSLASALNVSYLPELLGQPGTPAHNRRNLADLITHNRVFRSFAAAGYEIRAYSSEYHLVRPAGARERPAPVGYMTDFAYSAYESTAAPVLFQIAGRPRAWLPLALHRRHIRWTLDDLARRAGEPHQQPRLIFAHILTPHPPFAFNADGTSRPTKLPALLGDGDHWAAIAHGAGESYRSGYVDAVSFLNARLLHVVGSVVTDAVRPTVIYIQGDHGPGAGLKWSSAERSDVRERHGIMLAMRLPDGAQPPLGHTTSPINAFRVLLNRALGSRLPAVADRSYFATWEEPLAFLDVTDRVRAPAN